MTVNQPRSKNLGNRLAIAALRLLRKRGPMLAADVADELEGHPLIDKAAREIYPSMGWPKWRVTLNYQSTPFVRAGILHKDKGTWSLTDDGHKRVGEMSDDALIEFAARKHAESERAKSSVGAQRGADADGDPIGDESPQQVKRREQALAGIKEFIQRMDPYEFQNLVAALLRAMGYFISDIPDRPGADGGVDIVAYEDPLGASGARLKVQVKRYKGDSSAQPKDLRELHGLLTEGEAGVFVCTSDFSSKCREFARSAQRHLRLIDGDEFIRLWIEFHPKMKDEDKKRLPLYAVYFLDEETIPD